MRSFLSLGAGVQSTTIALMVKHGEITPAPEAAIFADTQGEPAAVYRHLEWLCSGILPFPVYRVTAGNLAAAVGARGNGRWPALPIPAHIDQDGVKAGLLNRSCTSDFKLNPIRRKIRELVGLARRRSPASPVVCQWMGISRDEAHRMRESREPWIVNRYPLIDLGMTRADCLRWMADHGYPRPPKSSCVFCPYHGTEQWRLTKADPEAWAAAVAMDEKIRDLWAGRVPGKLFLHYSRKPLTEAVLDKDTAQGELFGNECEGVCGV